MSPLSVETHGVETATERLMILHGIMGKGQNWRTLARRWVADRDRLAVLVDLRCHGNSTDFEEPHTVAACASDLLELASTVRPTLIMGHSFGGKVALSFAARNPGTLKHLILADAHPGLRPGRRGAEEVETALGVLRESTDVAFKERSEFLELCNRHGLPDGVARWLATNLLRTDAGLVMRLIASEIEALLTDYSDQDLWHVIGELTIPVSVILGGRSTVYGVEDKQRLASFPNANVREIPDAGHWVHVEAPKAFLAALEACS